MDPKLCTLSTYVSSGGTVNILDPDSHRAGQTSDDSHVAAFHQAATQRGLACVILAAGQGSRFVAETPKVIYPFKNINGEQRPLVAFSVEAAIACQMPIVMIVGHAREAVVQALAPYLPRNYPILFVVQEKQMGTGHAVYIAKHVLPARFRGDIVVTYADNPGVDGVLLNQLIERHDSLKKKLGEDYSALILTGSRAGAGSGASAYGRIVRETRHGGAVVDIVEKKTIVKLRSDGLNKTYSNECWNAGELENIDEFNSGIIIASADEYFTALGSVTASQTKFDPPKFEYYATDFVKGLLIMGKISEGWKIPQDSIWKLEGANTVDELRDLEQKHADRLKN